MVRGYTNLLAVMAGVNRQSTPVDVSENYPHLISAGPVIVHGVIVSATMSAHATSLRNGTVTEATPATNELGEFTEGAGGDVDSTFEIDLDDGDGHTLNIAPAAGATVTDAQLAAAFVAAGFTAAGAGTVNGYSLDLGAAATITAAITAESLVIVRVDGTDFTYTETTGGTAYGGATPTFANAEDPTTDGVVAALDAGSTLIGGVPASAAIGTTHNMLSQVCEDGLIVVPGNSSATGTVVIVWEPLPSY